MPAAAGLDSIGVVGRGRLGSALAAALGQAGYRIAGTGARGDATPADAVVLCVPDAEIPQAAAAVAGSARFVGHTSGATPLSALAPAADAGAAVFALHPLATFTAQGGAFGGAGCAIAADSEPALEVARELARALGMTPFEIDDELRGAYHAAASLASNFLVTLEASAEALAGDAGLDPPQARRLLAPLARASLANWAALGPERALTGPIARGDEGTVARQRAAVAAARPELIELFDALCARTRALAAGSGR